MSEAGAQGRRAPAPRSRAARSAAGRRACARRGAVGGGGAPYAIPPYVLPSPWLLLSTLIADWAVLSASLLVTLTTTLEGFALAVVGGVGLAVLFNQSRLIEYSLYPYAVILQVTPIVAIAPLLLVYLPQQAAVLACAWIVAFFPVLANTTLGLNSVDRNLADLFRLYGATRAQVLWELKLQAALPYILGGLKIAGGLSLIGAVVAEIAAGSAGAGSGLAYRIVEVRLPPQYPAHVRGAVSALGQRDRHLLRVVARLASHAAALARERHRPRGLALPCGARAPCQEGGLSCRLYVPAERNMRGREGLMAWIVSVVLAVVAFCAAPAQAQTYPAKPIHIMVPYAPGRDHRHRRAYRRRQAHRGLGPAGGGGEQARRQRLHRHDRGREGRAATATR